MPSSSAPRALSLACLLLLLSGCLPRLEPGSKLERVIAQGEHQRVELELQAGFFYHLVAEQPTADVVLTLFGPDGERVGVDVDATVPGQLEHLYFIPPASGRYELDVYALDLSVEAEHGEGRYALDLRQPRPPSDDDRLVEQAFWAESRALEFDAIQEDCAAAIVEYEKSAELWERASRPQNVAWVLLEQADCHLRLGQPAEGHRRYQRALALATELGDRDIRIKALTSLGVTSRALGRLDRAYDFHQSALELAREIATTDAVGRALNNLCMLFVDMGRQEAAKQACREAVELYDRAGWSRQKSRTLSNLGAAFMRQGRRHEALELFERAEASLEPGVSRLRLAILARQARARELLGEPEAARDLLEEVLEMSLELGELGTEARYRARLGSLLVGLGEAGAARRHAEQALALLADVENVVIQASVLGDAARVQWLTGSPEIAVATADEAIARLEQMRRSPQDFDDRATFLASRWSIYDLRVAIRMSLFASTRDPAWCDSALHAAEQARARGLLDRLRSERQPGVLEPAQIHRQLLGDSTGLLLFHLGERESYLWRLAHGETAVYVLPAMGQIQAAAQPLRQALTAREISPAGESARDRARRVELADEEAWGAGRHLAELLRLAEAAEVERINRWVVVPDGVLHRVPFAALPLPGGVRRPMLADREIVYAPSASSLAALRGASSQRATGRDFLALADPVFEISDPRHGTAEAEQQAPGGIRGSLARLPLTRLEVLEIAEIAPGESVVVTDHAASKARLLEEGLHRYAYLHIATHGLVDTQDPSRSALVLSRFDDAGRPVDGYLSLGELEHLELGARLVVLSACHSASGRELRGEGVLGLARGFLNAGVPRVVASRWTVEDGVTRDLMTSFYAKIWRDGLSPAAALRAAQLELWRRGLAPYHWAAFSFHGEWRR